MIVLSEGPFAVPLVTYPKFNHKHRDHYLDLRDSTQYLQTNTWINTAHYTTTASLSNLFYIINATRSVDIYSELASLNKLHINVTKWHFLTCNFPRIKCYLVPHICMFSLHSARRRSYIHTQYEPQVIFTQPLH